MGAGISGFAFVIGLLACALAPVALAETENFDGARPGGLPSGWIAGVTGAGSHRWQVATEAGAPSVPNVLEQTGTGDFPWCVKQDVQLADGWVEVKFRARAGSKDQAGGVVWRWKNGNTYYVARANALENNVSLYYTVNGRRSTIRYADAPVPKDVWHVLRVEFAGRAIRVALNGKTYIEATDGRISGAGAVGVWTKADSVTSFDDFAYAPAK